jgi:hypothetical protein
MMSSEYCINMISWSVPTTVESHLQRRSRKGDGLKRVDTDDTVIGTAIDGGIGCFEDSPPVAIFVVRKMQAKRGGTDRIHGSPIPRDGSELPAI